MSLLTLHNYQDMQDYGVDREFIENLWTPLCDLPHDVKQWIGMFATLIEFGVATNLILPRDVWIALAIYVTGQPGPQLDPGMERDKEKIITDYLKALEDDKDDIPYLH